MNYTTMQIHGEHASWLQANVSAIVGTQICFLLNDTMKLEVFYSCANVSVLLGSNSQRVGTHLIWS